MTQLALTHLKLSHFRSHKSAVLDVDTRPVALFGPNGAGKTNILEAVSLMSPGRGLRNAAAHDMAKKPEDLGWKLTAHLQSMHQTHEIETISNQGAARSVKIDEKTSSQLALGRVARVLWLVPSMDRLWIEGADGRRRFLDRMTLSFEPTHAEASLTYEKSMRERNRMLKDGVTDPSWYRAVEVQMAQSGARIAANRNMALDQLIAAQGDVETHFPSADLSLKSLAEFDSSETDDLARAFQDGRSEDMRAGRTLAGPHRTDLEAVYRAKNIPAKLCSTGEQKALLISLILANARALKSTLGMPPLLLLDEVAAHLDAERRAALYDEISALGAQAWMTGTETHLFDSLGDRALYFEVTEQDGASSVQPQA